MQHLVIHSDSCGCRSSDVKSWLLHHDNAPLLVRNVLANNNTVFTRLVPVYKTERTEIKTASLEELKTIPKSASRIGKSADTSVLYLKISQLRETYR